MIFHQQAVLALTMFCHFAESIVFQKCIPRSSADLAVQKKKVGEVKDWLLADHGPGLLLLTGAVLLLSAASALLRSICFAPWHTYCSFGLLQDLLDVAKPSQSKHWHVSWALKLQSGQHQHQCCGLNICSRYCADTLCQHTYITVCICTSLANLSVLSHDAMLPAVEVVCHSVAAVLRQM